MLELEKLKNYWKIVDAYSFSSKNSPDKGGKFENALMNSWILAN